jgi:hypothetical protein
VVGEHRHWVRVVREDTLQVTQANYHEGESGLRAEHHREFGTSVAGALKAVEERDCTLDSVRQMVHFELK